MAEPSPPYPSDRATAEQILLLAQSYRHAAQSLVAKKGTAISRAPCRFLALHAIELYQDALLLKHGHKAAAIRKTQHNIAMRAEMAAAGGLILRRKTVEHLSAATAQREYMQMRYSDDMPATLANLNRILATLEELAEKITAMVQPAKAQAKSAIANLPVAIAP